MRILLDECIDRRLSRGFVDFEVKTVPQMGWAGTRLADLQPLVPLILEAIPIAPKGQATTIALTP